MEAIKQHLPQAIGNNQLSQKASNELTLSGTLDLQVSSAIRQGKKAKDASVAELDQMFKTVFMWAGVRPQFWPTDIDLLFLHEQAREQYGGHTMEEIVLAFKQLANGAYQNKDGSVVKLYDYFTPAFFGEVMMHYRTMALEIGNSIADEVYTQKLKELPAPPVEELDWRQVIEQDYQFFLKNVDTHSTYPEDHYRILEEDGSFPKDCWKKKLDSVRQEMMRQINQQITVVQSSGRFRDQTPAMLQTYNKLKDQHERYKSGNGDGDLVLMAKQKVVRAFFKYNRDLGNQNIYVAK